MLVISNKGVFSSKLQENTLAAFEKALDLGADGIKADIRRCGSGELICYSDPSLWRMAKKFLYVEKTSLAKIREETGVYVPTLTEFCEKFRKVEKIIFHLRSPSGADAQLANLFAATLLNFNTKRWVVSSSHYLLLIQVRNYLQIRSALVLKKKLGLLDKFFLPSCNTVHFKIDDFDHAGRKFCLENKIKMGVTEVERESQALHCLDYQANYILTTNPSLFQR